MPLPEILLLALALAADAFSVGAAVGLRHRRPRQVFRLSWHFGLFQALMPLLGIAAGHAVERLTRACDHWIAFGLLAFVGGRMILSSFGEGDREEGPDPTRGYRLVLLSVAVSIDALAVGFTFGVTGVPFLLPVILIGVTASAATVAGMFLAGRIAGVLGRRAELAAGLVLVAIGIRILVTHLGG